MLTSDAVSRVFMDCLHQDAELPSDGSVPPGAVIAQGVVTSIGFHRGRLMTHRKEVHDLLIELSPVFMVESGGGWSFLNACMDKHERQWGEHRNVEQLLLLGLACGYVTYCLPKEMWPMFPGGMPYFTVNLQASMPE